VRLVRGGRVAAALFEAYVDQAHEAADQKEQEHAGRNGSCYDADVPTVAVSVYVLVVLARVAIVIVLVAIVAAVVKPTCSTEDVSLHMNMNQHVNNHTALKLLHAGYKQPTLCHIVQCALPQAARQHALHTAAA
jgi:hypothetical protein